MNIGPKRCGVALWSQIIKSDNSKMQAALMFGLTVALIAGVAYYVHSEVVSSSPDSGFLSSGKTPLWWVVDNSQVNGRQWLDFGNRSTRQPNEPYLALCLERAKAVLSDQFDLQVLVGRDAVYRVLGSSEDFCAKQRSIPPALWLAWCRATLLSRFGGLWMDGSVLVLPAASSEKIKARLEGKPVLMFGTDAEENLASGAAAAGASAGWSAVAHHPMWSGLERDLTALIDQGPPSWSSVEARRGLRTLWEKHCSGMTAVDREVEVGRDPYGRRLELETLLGATELGFPLEKEGMWVILPDGRDGLERASPWLWFTRLSREQILESKFVWAKLASGQRS